MNRFLVLSLIPFLMIGEGCAGKKVVPGIEERPQQSQPLKDRNNINELAYNYFTNGAILEGMGDIPGASRQYAEALKYCSTSNEIRYEYAATFFQMNDFRRALTEADVISPKSVDTWLLIADSYRALGKDDSSLAAYLTAVKIDPDNIGAYHYIAAYYQQSNKLDSATWAYENIARISPNYRVFQEVANLQMRRGLIDEALQNYIESIALDSSESNVRSYLGLSVIYEQKGDRPKAKAYLEIAARLSPQNVLIESRLLGFYQDDNEFDRAVATARTIIPLAPLDKGIVRRLGIIYYNADSLRLADSVFTALLNEGDDNIVDHYYVGRIALQTKDYVRAKEEFTRVTTAADSLADGWLNLGAAYGQMDSTAAERTVYDSALLHMRNLDDSLRILFADGAALEEEGKFDSSVAVFEIILKHRPDHNQSLNYLAYLLAEKGVRLDYAQELILKALKAMPDNGAYLDTYGWVLYKKGDYQNALRELTRAYQLFKDDPVVTEHLGDTYKALGDDQNALMYWRKALELSPDNKELKEKIGR